MLVVIKLFPIKSEAKYSIVQKIVLSVTFSFQFTKPFDLLRTERVVLRFAEQRTKNAVCSAGAWGEMLRVSISGSSAYPITQVVTVRKNYEK